MPSMYFFSITGKNWKTIPGNLKQLDVGPLASVWGVNKHDNIYILKGNSWQKVSGALKHVSSGASGVWGVNSANNIYFRNGVAPTNPAGSSWKNVPGKNKDKLEASTKLIIIIITLFKCQCIQL